METCREIVLSIANEEASTEQRCGDASDTVLKAARDRGCNIQVECGKVDHPEHPPEEHCWVKHRGDIVDPTIKQFEASNCSELSLEREFDPVEVWTKEDKEWYWYRPE